MLLLLLLDAELVDFEEAVAEELLVPMCGMTICSSCCRLEGPAPLPEELPGAIEKADCAELTEPTEGGPGVWEVGGIGEPAGGVAVGRRGLSTGS